MYDVLQCVQCAVAGVGLQIRGRCSAVLVCRTTPRFVTPMCSLWFYQWIAVQHVQLNDVTHTTRKPCGI